MNTFTKCLDCAHHAEVMEPDRFGVKHPSAEVVQCLIHMQFRSARMIRSCGEFNLKKKQEAA